MDIVLSDFHIGNKNSTLSSSEEAKRLSTQFAKEIASLDTHTEKVILLGDIFDWWDMDIARSMRTARIFFETLDTLADEILYIPGNHDHHALIICEEMERIQMMEEDRVPTLPFRDILRYEFPHRSDTFVEAPLLKGLFPGFSGHIQLVYPEYTLKWKEKEILLRHGHYLDTGLFQVMPWIFQRFVRKIQSEKDFEIINTPIYEHLYSVGSVPEINDFYQRIFTLVNKITSFFYRKQTRKDIVSRKDDITQFFTKFKHNTYPDFFIFGHTHFAGTAHLGTMELFNTGCWVHEQNSSHNTYLTIDDDIVVRALGKV